MNLCEVARSGKRFKKPGSTWFERAPSDLSKPGMTEFRVRHPDPGQKPFEVQIYIEDLLRDDWELEPDPVVLPSLRERILAALESFKGQLLAAVGDSDAQSVTQTGSYSTIEVNDELKKFIREGAPL